MPNQVTQKSVARYGIRINCHVETEVGRALIAEGLRCGRSTGHIAALVLKYWYEDTYLPAQKAKKKPAAR